MIHGCRNPNTGRKSGQAIIFLMVVLVVGLLVVAWNFDLHNIVSSKARIENASDAGALSAARWQGITLNMIGELNLVQAALLVENTNNTAGAQAVGVLRDRLALNGPLMALHAAQPITLINMRESDIEKSRGEIRYADHLRAKAEDLQQAAGFYRGVDEPYTGAWEEYGRLLSVIADDDPVLECYNFNSIGEYDGFHFLFQRAFYEAVNRKDWCWFLNNGYETLLQNYNGYTYWSPLPPHDISGVINGEYFGGDLVKYETALSGHAGNPGYLGYQQNVVTGAYPEIEFDPADSLHNQFYEYATQQDVLFSNNIDQADVNANWPTVTGEKYTWHFYDNDIWMRRWPTADDGFPYKNDHKVKLEYDYVGADAITRLRVPVNITTPHLPIGDREAEITGYSKVAVLEAVSCAKAFGYLPFDSANVPSALPERLPPHYFGLVLPAFHQVRLVPFGVSSAVYENIDNRASEEHLYDHLPVYMSGGIEAIRQFGDCFECKQLIKWEAQPFRAAGIAWLQSESNVRRCTPPERPSLPPMGSRTPRPGGGGSPPDTSGSGGTPHRR